mmetsp:Transcript_22275/g.46829  ORF Transcript_22275/g.46829 Transcript_22275/m.46829 type:complete len:319 (+) Transcript_22275:86-1042(+)
MQAFPLVNRHGFSGLYPQPPPVQFGAVAFLDSILGCLGAGKVDPAISFAATGVFESRKNNGFNGMARFRLNEFFDIGLVGVVIQSKDPHRYRLFFFATLLVIVVAVVVVCAVVATFPLPLLFRYLFKGFSLKFGIVLVLTLVSFAAFTFRLPIDAVLLCFWNNESATSCRLLAGIIFGPACFGIRLEIVRKWTIIALGAFPLLFVGETLALSFPSQLLLLRQAQVFFLFGTSSFSDVPKLAPVTVRTPVKIPQIANISTSSGSRSARVVGLAIVFTAITSLGILIAVVVECIGNGNVWTHIHGMRFLGGFLSLALDRS